MCYIIFNRRCWLLSAKSSWKFGHRPEVLITLVKNQHFIGSQCQAWETIKKPLTLDYRELIYQFTKQCLFGSNVWISMSFGNNPYIAIVKTLPVLGVGLPRQTWIWIPRGIYHTLEDCHIFFKNNIKIWVNVFLSQIYFPLNIAYDETVVVVSRQNCVQCYGSVITLFYKQYIINIG